MTERPFDRIVRPEPAAIRSIWPKEDRDFTPWLANNLDWLDIRELGALELVDVEPRLPGYNRNLDILAQAPDGTRVAIENQYNKIDHDHLTRAIAYALGFECGALVVIAEDHGGEFVRIAEYLNSAYESLGPKDGIAVFLITVKAQRVAESFVPRFEVICRPNEWLAEVQQAQQAAEPRATSGVSVTKFLAKCSPEFRPVAQRIVADWENRPAASVRVGEKGTSASLDYPYAPGSGYSSVYVVYPNSLTVSRGYFIESGVIGEREAELDTLLHDCFPDITDRPYYPATKRPDPTSVTRFADWLTKLHRSPDPA